jgi:hypothetical protein
MGPLMQLGKQAKNDFYPHLSAWGYTQGAPEAAINVVPLAGAHGTREPMAAPQV